jgi:hypothetical protein
MSPVYLIQSRYMAVSSIAETLVNPRSSFEDVVALFTNGDLEDVERVLALDPETLVCTDVSKDFAEALQVCREEHEADGFEDFAQGAQDFIDNTIGWRSRVGKAA